MGRIVLVTGGIRSGKSAFALARLEQADPATYIATAKDIDPEMHARIARHRAERAPHIQTVEESTDVAGALRALPGGLAVFECLGTWLNNRFWDLGIDYDNPDAEQSRTVARTVEAEAEGIAAAAKECKAEVWFVTNEVGWSLVPPTPIGRLYTDTLGRVNQTIAKSADEVYAVLSSIPMKIK